MKRQLWVLALALKDSGTPWRARIAIGAALAYVSSPIDLIPDFIPVLGQLDDLLIVPALIAFAIRSIPPEVIARCRREAYRRRNSGEKVRSVGGIVSGLLFGLAWAALAGWILCRLVRSLR
jgi:uncharacterized membrane protein YkvA (DUF1232 family)